MLLNVLCALLEFPLTRLQLGLPPLQVLVPGGGRCIIVQRGNLPSRGVEPRICIASVERFGVVVIVGAIRGRERALDGGVCEWVGVERVSICEWVCPRWQRQIL